MANSWSAFVWNVPPGGYAWVESRTGWVLTEQPAPSGTYGVRQYAPLKAQPALFRIFSQLPLDDREAMLAFANEYGYLGIKVEESLEDWTGEINELRQAIELWDKVQDRDVTGLRACMRREETEYADDGSVIRAGRWYYLSPTGVRFWVEPVAEQFASGLDKALLPALFFIQQRVNAHLRQAAPRLVYDQDLRKPVFQIVPNHLPAALWLQFAEAIAGNKQYRTCKECGKWFEVPFDEDRRKARRLFCDDACKSRDYRRRKERAQQLNTEGKSVKEVAKVLGTDAETIKKWVSKRKG